MKLNKFAYLYIQNHSEIILGNTWKYLEIYQKTWKNHGNIMEFCQSEKVGTLYQICPLCGGSLRQDLNVIKRDLIDVQSILLIYSAFCVVCRDI